MTARPCHVAIVGAGWSGLSAAIHLVNATQSSQRLVQVTLFDAAPQAGGRARGLQLHWGKAPIDVDNGQHLIVGAYRELLGLLRTLEIDARAVFDRRPLTLRAADGFSMCRSDAAWARRFGALSQLIALLGARGLTPAAKLGLARTLVALKRSGFRAAPGVLTVSQWWRASSQHPILVARLWRPLAIGTLNTAPENACAATFLNVLRDTLGAAAQASDFLLPRGTLGELFVEPALAWLRARGVRWSSRTQVDAVCSKPVHGALIRGDLVRSDLVRADLDQGNPPCGSPLHGDARRTLGNAPAWRLKLRGGEQVDCDALVLAVPPPNAARLLRGIDGAPADVVADLQRFAHRCITTAWCGWRQGTLAASLPAVQVLLEDPARGCHGQWLFDRGTQRGWHVAGIVVSDSAGALAQGSEALASRLSAQLVEELGVAPPERIELVSDKRATFACTPDRPRLHADACRPALPALWLAGDHAWPDYPATLEGALRAGRAASDSLLAWLRANR